MANRPRLTITVKKSRDGSPGEVALYLNPEARAEFIRQLQALDETDDHFHMMVSDWGDADVALDMTPYTDAEHLIQSAKVMLRYDSWDAEYFPHVMQSSSTAPDSES